MGAGAQVAVLQVRRSERGEDGWVWGLRPAPVLSPEPRARAVVSALTLARTHVCPARRRPPARALSLARRLAHHHTLTGSMRPRRRTKTDCKTPPPHTSCSARVPLRASSQAVVQSSVADSVDPKALGNLGNALLAQGELKKAYLDALVAGPVPVSSPSPRSLTLHPPSLSRSPTRPRSPA